MYPYNINPNINPEFYGYGGHMAGHSIIGVVLAILIAVLVISLIIRLVRFLAFGHWHGRMHRHDWRYGMSRMSSALDILNERYAKGEINKAEFEEKKKDLMS